MCYLRVKFHCADETLLVILASLNIFWECSLNFFFLTDTHLSHCFFCDLIHFLWLYIFKIYFSAYSSSKFLFSVSFIVNRAWFPDYIFPLSDLYEKGDKKRTRVGGVTKKVMPLIHIFLCSLSCNSIFPSLASDGVLIISQWAVMKTIPRGFYHLCYQYR